MVLAFLQAEIDSPRYGATCRQWLSGMGITRADFIDQADLSRPEDNAIRAELLGHYRGYGKNTALFTRFPDDVEWRHVKMTVAELSAVRYPGYDRSAWCALSAGTNCVGDGAANLDKIEAYEIPLGETTPRPINENIRCVANLIKRGRLFPELVLVQVESEKLAVIEGSTRATAYVSLNWSEPVGAMIGTSDRIRLWSKVFQLTE
jgi:hypothetical protein